MKRQLTIFIMFFSLISTLVGQKPSIELTFTAIKNISYAQLDSFKIINQSQGGDTILYYPDTVLVLDYTVGLIDNNKENLDFKVCENFPNPVSDYSTLTLFVPEKDEVNVLISDILGRVIINSEFNLEKGYHSFRFRPHTGNLFLFTAIWRGRSSSIKILSTCFNNFSSGDFEYLGMDHSLYELKSSNEGSTLPFSYGDKLLFICYLDTLQSGLLDIPEENRTYTFQFATNISCPGTPSVAYYGKIYHTIQIFNQCWLIENLNAGVIIPADQWPEDNGIIERTCYNNNPDSCAKYGGLYTREEMMQYNFIEGTQGICPPGWHIPTDDEWKILEGMVDSQYGIGNQEWDYQWSWRGYDAGLNLKSSIGWYQNGNGIDKYGFSGLPGGEYDPNQYGFGGASGTGYWWTSTVDGEYSAWNRVLMFDIQPIWRSNSASTRYSVRCLKDY